MAGRGVRRGCIHRNEKQSCCNKPEPTYEAHGAIFADVTDVCPFAVGSVQPRPSVPPEPALRPQRLREYANLCLLWSRCLRSVT